MHPAIQETNGRRDLPAEDGATKNPCHIALIVRGIDVLRKRVSASRVVGVVRPFGDRRRGFPAHRFRLEKI